MREDVLIILNEREPLKSQMASELEEHLSQRGLSNSRLQPSANLLELVAKRNPKVIVMDYLLGDVATALDIISELQSKNLEHKSRAIIWTDEPSVNVAVQAMKLGADDYILLNSTNSLEKLLEAIDNSLQRAEVVTRGTRANSQTQKAYEEPVAQSAAFREALALAQGIAERAMPITLLVGEAGVGRSTIARYIHNQRQSASLFTEIDIDLWDGKADELFGSSVLSAAPLSSAVPSTLFLDHIEADLGELADYVQTMSSVIWNNSTPKPDGPMLIIGTSCPETVNVWTRLFSPSHIEIPALSAREEDMLPLIQRFAQAFPGSAQQIRNIISPKLLTILSAMPWSGNVRELRSCIIDALATPSTEGHSKDPQLPAGSSDLTDAEKEFLVGVIAARDRWQRFFNLTPYTPEPLQARVALDEAQGNYRIAAARLGTSVQQVRLVAAHANTRGRASGKPLL